MNIELSLLNYVLMFFLIGFGGFIDSIAGGGGLITVPTYLAIGIPPHLILGTNKCVSTAGGTVAIFRYFKSGSIDLSLMIYGVVAALIGSAIGAHLSHYLDSQKMVYILIVLVPTILVINFKKNRIIAIKQELLTNIQLISRCIAIGFIIGGYDGFFGPGTGTFLIIAFIFFLNMEITKASPNARIINFTSNISAFIVFLFKGLVAWKIASIAIIASLIGNYFGSGFVIKGDLKVIKYVFNFVLVTLLIKSIYDSFQL